MTWTSLDRWTCPHPDCRVTVAPDLPDAEIPAAIRAAQLEHGRDHPLPFTPIKGRDVAVARRRRPAGSRS